MTRVFVRRLVGRRLGNLGWDLDGGASGGRVG